MEEKTEFISQDKGSESWKLSTLQDRWSTPLYKSDELIMPKENFDNFTKNILIDKDLKIQKIFAKSFLDFENNKSESFQNLFKYINLFVQPLNFKKNTIQIGPIFYMQNWENSEFVNMLEDNLKEEKEIILYILDHVEIPFVEYKNLQFNIEKNYAVIIRYEELNPINLKNFKNTKFICAWKRYA